jgi:hypothetical protein
LPVVTHPCINQGDPRILLRGRSNLINTDEPGGQAGVGDLPGGMCPGASPDGYCASRTAAR